MGLGSRTAGGRQRASSTRLRGAGGRATQVDDWGATKSDPPRPRKQAPHGPGAASRGAVSAPDRRGEASPGPPHWPDSERAASEASQRARPRSKRRRSTRGRGLTEDRRETPRGTTGRSPYVSGRRASSHALQNKPRASAWPRSAHEPSPIQASLGRLASERIERRVSQDNRAGPTAWRAPDTRPRGRIAMQTGSSRRLEREVRIQIGSCFSAGSSKRERHLGWKLGLHRVLVIVDHPPSRPSLV